MLQLFYCLLALAAGGAIGSGFGLVQEAALRRNQKLHAEGKYGNSWAVLPGSGRRVAYLLVALALVQFFCPMLFMNGTQWWVSGGVLCGYGFSLYRQMRQRLWGQTLITGKPPTATSRNSR